ncbi:2-keto-4-methylthiobutyrate aminotransferase apoenzyme [Cnuella takakiae]|uniref:2-keto-4-methylthiobutyrate aminotransferase apoenzyme n=1 Tax=Cnuella takakiae TaxID=1302690 RepID=A0A1M5F5W9_9BACT|nr:methionine aminotransferase [Cnuella takakiae]OLY90988.1 methionine aminotransferase [Cnuella takakiae]SHF86943.1 2-keto-4-methylthiobutyrate aminotransferase apoenzyme [Cnuella takakiae]
MNYSGLSSPFRGTGGVSKLPNVGTTIFTVMSVLANEHKAINLGQGFPDFPMSEELTGLVCAAMRDGYNQYAHMNGYMPLREGLAAKIEELYGTIVNPDTQITVVPGGTYGLFTAMATILHPGDEVIVFEPAYDCYIPTIEIFGAKAVRINLQFPHYSVNWEEVSQRITERTRAIIINTPHNPTGSILRAADLQQLQTLVQDTGIYVISDEVYEHITFDGERHESVLRYPELMERAFVSFSFGKNYHCTGWKLGYSVAPPALMKEFRKVHQFNCFSCDTPKQVAIAQYLNNKDAYLQLGSFLQAKRDYLQQLLTQTRFEPLPSKGSFFQLYSYKNISDETEAQFAQRLVKEHGVAVIPVSAFYQDDVNNGVVRFCFVKKEETLEAAVQKLIHL